jgi:hypothetical protein
MWLDEINVRGKLREEALPAVGAITGDFDLIFWEPFRHQFDEPQCEFGPRAMIWVLLGSTLLFRPSEFLPLVQPGGSGTATWRPAMRRPW